MLKPIAHFLLCIMTLSIADQPKPFAAGVYHWSDFPVKTRDDRESRSIFEGTSPHFEYLEIHATTQMPGAKPSPPHDNKDIEELIIVKEGKVKVTLGAQVAILEAGGIALILPHVMQTFENIGNTQLTYYVMRYRSKKEMDVARGEDHGGSLMINMDSREFKPNPAGGMRSYFDRPTSMCENLEMHVTQRDKKGPSHSPHGHIDSEMVLVLDGQTEVTIDNKVYNATAGDFYFIPSGLIHTVGNGSDATCSYLAFKWR